MLEELKKHKDHIEFFDISNIPLNRDCFLLGDSNIDLIEKQWLEFLTVDCNIKKWKHPNEMLDYFKCSIESVKDEHVNIKILIDSSTRFHAISKSLPKEKLKLAFTVFSAENKPYVIVDQQWFDNLKTSIYSAYVLIDFVDTTKLILKHGVFPTEKLDSIKSIVDNYCLHNKDLTFLTCADNIIIKSGWGFQEASTPYDPEKLIRTVYSLMTDIKDDTDIDSYAIFTQGTNYVNESNLSQSNTPSNHYFISSISVPFIEAFEIDENIRASIRNEKFEKTQFYLESSFYLSSNRKFYRSEEPDWFKKEECRCKKFKSEIYYYPVSYENINELIDLNSK